MTDGLVRIRAQRASEVCAPLMLSETARRLLGEETTPAEYIDRLMQEACYADAVMVLAHALPKRQAVWWACLCARGSAAGPGGRAALEAAEAWVLKPNEENRRRAGAAAETAGADAAAGWCASAAFWSGPDIAPEGSAAPLAPGETMTAAAVAGAVILSAAKAPAPELENAFRRSLAQGLDIAAGGTGRLKDAPAETGGPPRGS